MQIVLQQFPCAMIVLPCILFLHSPPHAPASHPSFDVRTLPPSPAPDPPYTHVVFLTNTHTYAPAHLFHARTHVSSSTHARILFHARTYPSLAHIPSIAYTFPIDIHIPTTHVPHTTTNTLLHAPPTRKRSTPRASGPSRVARSRRSIGLCSAGRGGSSCIMCVVLFFSFFFRVLRFPTFRAEPLRCVHLRIQPPAPRAKVKVNQLTKHTA